MQIDLKHMKRWPASLMRYVTKIKFAKIRKFENIYIVRNQQPTHILVVIVVPKKRRTY